MKGRPTGVQKRRDHNGNFLYESDRRIIDSLQTGPKTFTGLMRTTGLSSFTILRHVKRLEKLGYVEREPQDRRILRIGPRAAEPAWKTLYILSSLSSFPLDLEAGRKLLTEKVAEAALEISSLRPNPGGHRPLPQCAHPPSLVCFRELAEELNKRYGKLPPLKPEKLVKELNECTLLTALARFNAELRITEGVEENHLLFFSAPEKLPRLLREGREDPEVFPALGVAGKTGTRENFLGLLDWVRPLIEGPLYTEARRAYRGRKPERIAGLEARSIIFTSPNLASTLFWERTFEYEREVLLPLWVRRLEGKRCT